MKPAIHRVVVFRGADGAERPRRHCGQRPIVREAADDRKSRSAVRAVDVRVSVAAVGGVEQLLDARIANGQIGRDSRGRPAVGFAEPDFEPGLPFDIIGMDLDGVDVSGGRGIHAK